MEGKSGAAADSRLLMKSVWCASVDPLMEEKQQHEFPSLALIRSLSGGSVVNARRRRWDGECCATDVKEKVRRDW